jgi:hypothetical protein
LEVKDNRTRCKFLPHVSLPEPEQDFVQERPLESLVKGMFQAKLKLLCERVLMQFLATQELLAGEEMGSPLLRLMFLPGQWVIEPLKDLMAPVGWGNLPRERLVFLSEQGVIESLMKIRSLLG